VTAPSRRLVLSCFLLAIVSLLVALWSLKSGVVSLTLDELFAALRGDAGRGRAWRQRGDFPVADA